MWTIVNIALFSYLLGSISFARILTRLFAPERDINHTLVPVQGSEQMIEMHGVSATSVRMQLGPTYGLLTTALDMLKVALPVWFVKNYFPEQEYFLVAAGMGVIGHNWPLFYRFKGGYGMSAIYGGMLLFEWLGVVVAFIGTGLVALATRNIYAGMLGGMIGLIPWMWFHNHSWTYVAYAVLINLAYFIKLLPDIQKIRNLHRTPDFTE